MDDLVGPHRDDVFLDQHFDTVGDWLKKTERSHTIWAVSVLHPCKNFSFQHRDEREKCEEYSEQHENIDQTRYHLNHPSGQPRQPRKQPLLCVEEDLVDRLAHPG
jgi:hypothetical protein